VKCADSPKTKPSKSKPTVIRCDSPKQQPKASPKAAKKQGKESPRKAINTNKKK
jgi:hypothetical protein